MLVFLDQDHRGSPSLASAVVGSPLFGIRTNVSPSSTGLSAVHACTTKVGEMENERLDDFKLRPESRVLIRVWTCTSLSMCTQCINHHLTSMISNARQSSNITSHRRIKPHSTLRARQRRFAQSVTPLKNFRARQILTLIIIQRHPLVSRSLVWLEISIIDSASCSKRDLLMHESANFRA